MFSDMSVGPRSRLNKLTKQILCTCFFLRGLTPPLVLRALESLWVSWVSRGNSQRSRYSAAPIREEPRRGFADSLPVHLLLLASHKPVV